MILCHLQRLYTSSLLQPPHKGPLEPAASTATLQQKVLSAGINVSCPWMTLGSGPRDQALVLFSCAADKTSLQGIIFLFSSTLSMMQDLINASSYQLGSRGSIFRCQQKVGALSNPLVFSPKDRFLECVAKANPFTLLYVWKAKAV